MAKVHVIGAGLAGLGCAVRLAHLGRDLIVYESAPRAGGRCRSYHDPQLDRVIDNGNHLILSGNTAIMAYLKEIGASDSLAGPETAAFPFVDAATAARWTLKPGDGALPWWLLDPARRVPQTHLWDYLTVARVLRAVAGQTMSDCVGGGALYRNFWEPLTVAVLNTAPAQAAADLMGPVLRETILKGAQACRPLVARESLAASLIDPAVAYLKNAGVDVRFSARIRELIFRNGRLSHIESDGAPIMLGDDDLVILAVPPWAAQDLAPWLETPPAGEPIVNVHYRLPRAILGDGMVKIVGVVGGLAQWVFARGDIAAVTISAAGDVVDLSAAEIARRCWPDVALALELGDMPEVLSRVVKERRATFAQTPAAARRRPGCVTATPNLLLAGDWTATGLPATIEGAVRSGFTAAAKAREIRERAARNRPTKAA